MTYNAFFDTWFSYSILAYGIPAALFVLVLWFRDRLYMKKKYAFLLGIAWMAFPVLLLFCTALINPIYFGYGQPDGVTEVRMMNGKLYVMDFVQTMRTRLVPGEPYSRIHELDPSTGTKARRFTVGPDAELVGIHGDSVVVSRYNDVAYYSAANGHFYAVYNYETLPHLFPELSTGIENYIWGDGRNVMEINSRDGKAWSLYTCSSKIYPALANGVTDRAVPTHKLYIHDKYIRRDDNSVGVDVRQLSYATESQHLRYIGNGRDSILNPNFTFIDGMPVVLNKNDSSFVILSYETTEKRKFILTCVSFDGQQKLWEIKQSSLNPKYIFHPEEKVCVGSDEQQRVFVAIDDEVIALNLQDGKVLWRKSSR